QITVTDELTFRYLDIYMHPKYNHWIATNAEYNTLKGRTLRIICGTKILPLVNNHYSNEDLPRHARVALMPPTQYLIIVLNQQDKPFIKANFHDRIGKDTPPHRLWLKVIYVEHYEHDSPNASLNASQEGLKNRRTDLFLNDMSSDAEPILLSLFDEQTLMASMIKRNDYIALYDPKLSTRMTESQMQQADIVFEFTSDTVIFLMPEKEAQDAGLAKVDLASVVLEEEESMERGISNPKKVITQRDEEGFMDCTSYSDRIYINQLQHNMINVALLGRIVAVADNNPFMKDNEKMNRYAMKIADATGVVDITLWEAAGHDSRALLPGQYVLLSRLSTSNKYKTSKGTTWYVNGSAACGTKVYNVSTLSSLLSSSSFRVFSTIYDAKKKKRDHFQAEVMITGWELHIKSSDPRFVLSDEYTQIQDSADLIQDDFSNCLRPVDARDKINCKFCGCSIHQQDKVEVFRHKPDTSDVIANDWQGWIEWRLDDGSDWCRASGGEELLLRTAPRRFMDMSHEAQVSLLDSVVGNQIICSLSVSCIVNYTLNQLYFLSPTLSFNLIKMKSALLIAAGVVSAATQASAAISIITPWGDTTWTSGGAGNITWTATGTDASAKCDIQLLNGNFTNANMVAEITATGSPVACSAGSYVITPLNDFASGSYWIRIGQSATANWYYSGVFKFSGKGTAAPLSLASSAGAVAASASASAPLSTAAGASASAAAVTTGVVAGKNAASASASASASSTTSGASILTMSKVAAAAGAIAAIAFSL
ncbi:hypothetical protein K501DRAFT_203510, partial [Backusella circina FSU 941]